MGNYLLGSYSARLDKSGRLKIPQKFRTTIEEQYGKELFITSLDDQAVQIYPLPVWKKLAGISDEGLIHLRPEIRSFMRRVNLKGAQHEIDSKGRILINQKLKTITQLNEDVTVVGLNTHMEIWNKENLDKLIEENPLTDKDFEQIAGLKPQGQKE